MSRSQIFTKQVTNIDRQVLVCYGINSLSQIIHLRSPVVSYPPPAMFNLMKCGMGNLLCCTLHGSSTQHDSFLLSGEYCSTSYFGG